MRYSKEHKQATRQRIVEAAGRRFKEDGIDGTGVATVMSDAGLTNGAFYAHFKSKEDLVANVLADQLRVQRESFDAEPADRAGLEAFIRANLYPPPCWMKSFAVPPERSASSPVSSRPSWAT